MSFCLINTYRSNYLFLSKKKIDLKVCSKKPYCIKVYYKIRLSFTNDFLSVAVNL